MAKYWTGYFGAPCYYPENLPSAKAMKAAADITPTVDVGPQATGSYYTRFAAASGYEAVGAINRNTFYGQQAAGRTRGTASGGIDPSGAVRPKGAFPGGGSVIVGGGSGGWAPRPALIPGFGQVKPVSNLLAGSTRTVGTSKAVVSKSSVKSPFAAVAHKAAEEEAARKAAFTFGKQSPAKSGGLYDVISKPAKVAADKKKAAEAQQAQANRKAILARSLSYPVKAADPAPSAPSESPPLPPVTVPTSSGGGGGFASGGGGGAWTADPAEFDETVDVTAPTDDGTAKRNKMLMIAGAAVVGLYLWSKRKK